MKPKREPSPPPALQQGRMGLSLLLVTNIDLEELGALKAPPVLCRRDGPDPAMSQAPFEHPLGFPIRAFPSGLCPGAPMLLASPDLHSGCEGDHCYLRMFY